MKNKEIQELKIKTLPELESLLKENQNRFKDLKFNLAAGKVKNVTRLRHVRRDIARILTFINQSQTKKTK
ncbi:MAG: 50S ribosomal protein L29 [Candidatus Liptonbacteria bacterium]|nr:50S ribosomal protein L29 [Candidatus Liptonbacteria bacterium]